MTFNYYVCHGGRTLREVLKPLQAYHNPARHDRLFFFGLGDIIPYIGS